MLSHFFLTEDLPLAIEYRFEIFDRVIDEQILESRVIVKRGTEYKNVVEDTRIVISDEGLEDGSFASAGGTVNQHSKGGFRQQRVDLRQVRIQLHFLLLLGRILKADLPNRYWLAHEACLTMSQKYSSAGQVPQGA